MHDLLVALEAFYAGDAPRLAQLLTADPSLVRARMASSEGHYCGYFHQATLLHHVAGNPTIRPLPANTVELAELILDSGAEPTHLTTHHATLEDVFMALTGRRLRDA